MNFEHAGYYPLLIIPLLILVLLLMDVKLGKKVFSLLKLNIEPSNNNRTLKHLLAWLGIVFLFLALLGPKGNPHYSNYEIESLSKAKANLEILDLVIVLDTSSSMAVTDTQSKETRLKVALEALDDLLQKDLQAYLTLYVFTSKLEKIVPRTLDQVFFRLVLKGISINEPGVPGTDFKQILGELSKENISSDQAVLLVSDGDDTELATLPLVDQAGRLQEIRQIFKHPMSTLGVGSPSGGIVPNVVYKGKPVVSKLNADLLKAIGEYNELGAGLSPDLLKQLKRRFEELKIKSTLSNPKPIYDDYTLYPLAVALLLMAAAWLYPSTSKKVLPLFVTLFLQAESPELLYDSGDYSDARQVLESMTAEDDWQKGAKSLDIAITFLLENKGDEASLELSKIKVNEASNPYFLRKWHQVKGLLWRENSSIFTPFLLRMGLQEISSAEKAQCELEKLKQAPSCRPLFILHQIKTDLKNKLSDLQENSLDPSLTLSKWLQRVKEGTYINHLYDPELKTWTDPDLKEALRNLRQNDPVEGQEFLEKALLKYPAKTNPLNNPFVSLEDQLLWIGNDFKLMPQETASPLLKEAIGGLYGLIGYRSLNPGASIEQQKSRVQTYLKNFPQVAYRAQVKSFLEKGCERINWAEVYPPYLEALLWLDQSDDYSLYMAVINLKKALKALEDPYNKPPPEESSETIRSFQDLMLQDQKAPASVQGGSTVEKPW